jgi:HlyD family secretion protein
VHVKLGDQSKVSIDAYGDRKFNGTVEQIANTGKTTGTGTQEEVTNFEVKIRLNDHNMRLRPGLSCTADIQTDMVKDVVAVPIQSVTIRTSDSNLSPEEIEQKKKIADAKEQGDNRAQVENERLARQAEKEEREKLKKVVFLKDGGKAKMCRSRPASRTMRT